MQGKYFLFVLFFLSQCSILFKSDKVRVSSKEILNMR